MKIFVFLLSAARILPFSNDDSIALAEVVPTARSERSLSIARVMAVEVEGLIENDS